MPPGSRNFDRALYMLLSAHFGKVIVRGVPFRVMARRLGRGKSHFPAQELHDLGKIAKRVNRNAIDDRRLGSVLSWNNQRRPPAPPRFERDRLKPL